MSKLEKNYEAVKSSLKNAKLLVVTKNRPVADIQALYNLGQRHFGENKIQELKEKSEQFNLPDIHWHFIGRIQSNKVNTLALVRHLYAIHSLGSEKLVHEFKKKALPFKDVRFYLQVNTSEEEQKQGFATLSQLKQAIEFSQPGLWIEGLMTMGKIRTEDFKADAEACFKELITMRDRLNANYLLSMGMSQDYEIADRLGANWVRVGSKIFQ